MQTAESLVSKLAESLYIFFRERIIEFYETDGLRKEKKMSDLQIFIYASIWSLIGCIVIVFIEKVKERRKK